MSEQVNDARRGRFWMDDEVIDRFGAQLGAYGLCVYTMLCRRADKNGRSFPSLRKMAADLAISERQAKRELKKLKDLQLISIEARRDEQGKQQASVYTILELPEDTQSPGPEDSQSKSRGTHSPPKEDPQSKEVTPQSETEFPPSGASAQPSATNWFTVFCERAEDFGYKVTPDDRKELPRNLRLVAAEQDEPSMKRIVLKCLEARAFRTYPISPQRARDEVLGQTSKQANAKANSAQSQRANATPEPAAQALAEHELKRYAYLCERFDFTSEDEPPYPVLKALGGTENEQHSNLTRMRSVARRALRACRDSEAEASHVAA